MSSNQPGEQTADLPAGMLQGDRPVVPEFDADEELYRRLMPQHLVRNKVHLAAIDLPDISTLRSKLANSDPSWALKEPSRVSFEGWGVFGMPISRIPAAIYYRGVESYDIKIQHVPHARNYPHSEIRAYSGEKRLDKNSINSMPPESRMRFRHKLLQICQMRILPSQLG